MPAVYGEAHGQSPVQGFTRFDQPPGEGDVFHCQTHFWVQALGVVVVVVVVLLAWQGLGVEHGSGVVGVPLPYTQEQPVVVLVPQAGDPLG